MTECINCGEWFDDDGDEWKVRCLECWREWKATQGPAIPKRRRPSAGEVLLLRLENARLRHELTTMKNQPALPEDFKAHLPRLLQLCHPDRHGGSAAANMATAWLLEQRKLLP